MERQAEAPPSDAEMAAWLDCDRTVLLSQAMITTSWPAPGDHACLPRRARRRAKRARVRNGPMRYSRYSLIVFLLTSDGVRQMTADLLFVAGDVRQATGSTIATTPSSPLTSRWPRRPRTGPISSRSSSSRWSTESRSASSSQTSTPRTSSRESRSDRWRGPHSTRRAWPTPCTFWKASLPKERPGSRNGGQASAVTWASATGLRLSSRLSHDAAPPTRRALLPGGFQKDRAEFFAGVAAGFDGVAVRAQRDHLGRVVGAAEG